MPKDTFFNLPEEKKKKITDAAFRVLEEHPYDEVSINMIIREAEIPRGSFYQYFEDKDDLIRYMFKDLRRTMGSLVARDVITKLEDLDELVMSIFDVFISFGSDERNIKVFTNAFSDPQTVGMFLADTAKDMELLVEEIKQHLDRAKLRLSSEEEINILIGLAISAFKDSVGECFRDMSMKEKVMKDFKIKLDIISYGAAAKEGNR